MVAALVLGYYSYRSADQLAQRTEASVGSSNRVLGLKIIDRIEKVIIDNDRTFFRLVNLDDPKEFMELWRRIIRVSPAVDSVIVLSAQVDEIDGGVAGSSDGATGSTDGTGPEVGTAGNQQLVDDLVQNLVDAAPAKPDGRRAGARMTSVGPPRLLHFVSKLSPSEKRWFRKVLLDQIVPDLRLQKLPVNKHKHWHKEYGGKTYLLSYIRRSGIGRDYFIVLSINIGYLLKELFVEEFEELESSRHIAVMDEGGRVLHGRPVAAADSQLVFEGRFPTTLYKWRLQIAPRDVAALRREAETRRVLDLVLVATAVGVIFLGMVAMAVAVRKQRRANELKSEFIANVSHELKTPLSLIRMFGELLALNRAEGRQTAKEYAEIIMRESDRLSSLIDNVLDFARIERGKAAYAFERAPLAPVLRRAVELAAYRCDQAKVTLTATIPDDLPQIELDESAITLMVLNLIENALKYGSVADGEIRMSVRRDVGLVIIRVADDGPGIAPEEQRRIFDRFYRGREPRRKSIRGSGIGLSLVKHIAEAHGGRVSVESELGSGAAFEVTIRVTEEA